MNILEKDDIRNEGNHTQNTGNIYKPTNLLIK